MWYGRALRRCEPSAAVLTHAATDAAATARRGGAYGVIRFSRLIDELMPSATGNGLPKRYVSKKSMLCKSYCQYSTRLCRHDVGRFGEFTC